MIESATASGQRFRQIVICGFPRSGTSLLYNILSVTLPGFHFPSEEQSAVDWIAASANVVTKYPMDVFEIAGLGSANVLGKEIAVLLCLRDVRDVITSRHQFLPDRYFIGYDHSWRPDRRHPSGWSYTGYGVGAIFRQIEALAAVADLQLLEVRYEDLVGRPDLTQRAIATALSLDFLAPFADFHAQRHRHAFRHDERETIERKRESDPLDPGRIGKWRDPAHRQRIGQQFGEFPALGAIVRRLRYEDDDGWLTQVAAGGTDSAA